jgi:hypothetical protein
MIDDRNDINRTLGSDPYLNQRPCVVENRGYGWGVPVGIAALFILAGFLFYNARDHGPDQTASNNTPAVTQTNPSGPARPAPAPAPNSAR